MSKVRYKRNNASPSLAKGKRSKFPADIAPMLATLVDRPFDEPGWSYEVKWDGYRAIAYLQKDDIQIRSRNNKSFDKKFYPIHSALQQWNINAVVDGEIIVVNEKGVADFGDLQNWRSEADGQLMYYIFDLLWYDGNDLTELPLQERREILRSIAPTDPLIRISETFDATGTSFFSIIDKMGLEGIIAKKDDSKYVPGIRSKEWLKIKTEKRQEFVIGGYTLNENTNKLFSALLVGVYNNGVLDFVTPVGTGFSKRTQEELLERMKPLITKKCPFSTVPDYNKPSRFRPDPPKATVTWIRPELIAEISYREETKDGAIRHPSFKGLREDKQAKEVVREKEKKTTDILNEEKILMEKKLISAPGKKERKTLLNPKDASQVRSINGHELKFSNLGKVYWPKDNVTKRDMLNYYYQVAPYILPYLKDRPQTLYRFPNGIDGMKFYQKDVKDKAPEWIHTFPYYSAADEREKEFLVHTNEASLLYTAALGTIEMNPWSSRIQKPDHPDWCIIDLDPDKNPFEQVITTAEVTRQVLDSIGIEGYCKTSGSTGLHIYIPLGAKYTYEDSKEFGRAIAKLVHAELPKFTSIERKTADRKGKIYVDFLQNRPQATVASPYSLRPKPGAPVSMPLHWEEVKKGLTIQQHNIHNAVARIREQGDIFKPVIGKGIDMKKALKKLEPLK